MKLETRRTTNSHKLIQTIVKYFSKPKKFQEIKTFKIGEETLKKHKKRQGQSKGKSKQGNLKF